MATVFRGWAEYLYRLTFLKFPSIKHLLRSRNWTLFIYINVCTIFIFLEKKIPFRRNYFLLPLAIFQKKFLNPIFYAVLFAGIPQKGLLSLFFYLHYYPRLIHSFLYYTIRTLLFIYFIHPLIFLLEKSHTYFLSFDL